MGNTAPDLVKMLSAGIIESLKENERIAVVEWKKLVIALDELNLGTSSLVDDSIRLRIVALVSARLMIFGGYQVIGRYHAY